MSGECAKAKRWMLAKMSSALPDPIGLITTICKQQRSRFQARQQLSGKSIVVSLAWCQRKSDGKPFVSTSA
jgi:hypothetical protein